MKANQAKMDAHREANQEHMQQMMAKIETIWEEMMTGMDTNQERMNASLREEIQSGQAKMRFIINARIADMKDGRRETMSCQVMTEVCLDSRVRIQKTWNLKWNIGRSLRKRPQWNLREQWRSSIGWHLAAGRHGEQKELTWGNCVSQRKLSAPCRKVSYHARVSCHKRNIVRNKWTRAKAERGIWRVQTLRESEWMHREGRKGVTDLGGWRLSEETTMGKHGKC
jgi:hypothetical protein